MCVQSGAGANTFLPILSFASLLRWCLLLSHRLDVVLFPDVRAVTALLERGSVSFRVPLVVELWYGGARSFGCGSFTGVASEVPTNSEACLSNGGDGYIARGGGSYVVAVSDLHCTALITSSDDFIGYELHERRHEKSRHLRKRG
ncbi:hypothetical protein F2Q69_00022537 [Brassica cretica]|uniref:Secreted protein n=1 Tax=Brassica cretica TaxID=69181 RepID=A0A8S9QGM3_BRACR|nr:hypothetical protein F2Q69_00022537 [Brassica cretica]